MLPLYVGKGEVECKLKRAFKEPVKSAAVGLSILSLVLVAERALRLGTEEKIQDCLALVNPVQEKLNSH